MTPGWRVRLDKGVRPVTPGNKDGTGVQVQCYSAAEFTSGQASRPGARIRKQYEIFSEHLLIHNAQTYPGPSETRVNWDPEALTGIVSYCFFEFITERWLFVQCLVVIASCEL